MNYYTVTDNKIVMNSSFKYDGYTHITQENIVRGGDGFFYLESDPNIPSQPPQPDNEVISPRQLRLYLFRVLGITGEQLSELVADNEAAKIELEYAGEIHKQNPLIVEFAQKLELDEEAVTTLFNHAKEL